MFLIQVKLCERFRRMEAREMKRLDDETKMVFALLQKLKDRQKDLEVSSKPVIQM